MKLQFHPELREGEVFLGNFTPEGYDSIGRKTKRKGDVAYDVHGGRVEMSWFYFFPVFVQRKELEEGGITFDE